MRGDVHRLRDDRASRGPEQRGRRFAVVLQSDDLPLSTLIVAPTSTSALPTDFRPEITIDGRTTLVLVEQMKAIHPPLLGERVGHLTRDELDRVLDAVLLVLGMD